jgi:dihydroxyacetone kinase
LGSTVEEGGQRAHSIVSGADLNIDGAERAERARLIGLAHDRIADATEAVAATVRYNGEETPLRGLASTVSMHVVNALMSEDRASLRAVSQPFEGFVTIEGFTTAAPAD